MTLFPANTLPSIETPKVSNITPRIPHSYFVVSSFTVWLTLSINTPELSGNFMILIRSSIYPFKLTTVILSPVLTTPPALFFFE